MTPERFREVDRLVNLVLDHPDDDRTELLDAACAGDVELRAAVDSFLDSKEELGDFLAQPPSELAGDLLASGPLAPGVRLGRYVIRERIGGGGMGVVYAAYDPELDRRVALKLVSPAVAGTDDESQGQARLLREAQAMARLSHPSVMPIYDVGTFGDQVFIAMEFVEGSTLTEWLVEPKRPWREIVSMFVQAGRGLAAAHGAGLLHRDFKPNNVLVGQDGRARVLDFGLARPAQPDKSAERSAADGPAPADTKSTPRLAMLGVTVTQRGKFVGTPAYMAPEQLMGERADERTDLYSFCVALYQGLYGELPFSAENLSSLLELVKQGRVKEAPSATSVPSWLRRILLRGLSPNPAERYPSMEVLLDELVRHRALPRRRSVILASLILLMGVAGATWMVLERKNAAKGIQSIAVLPLENLTGDASQEAFVDGFTAALNQNLADLSAASVISRESAIRYKATKKPVSEIGRELDVDGVVRGSVKRSGSHFQVRVELIHAATGRQLWAKSYEREPQETVVLQADVAADLVGEVESSIKPERQARLARMRSVKPEVYQAYLTGRFFLNKRNEADLRRGIAYFEQAIREDIQYAPAYAGLAEVYFFLAHPASALEPKEASRLATAAAKKALSLDPTLGEAHAILAFVKDHLDWDWRSAEQEYKLALELNPNHAMVHKWYSGYLARMGRRDESLVEAKRAQRLDPLAANAQLAVAEWFAAAGQYDKAIKECQKALLLDPNNGAVRGHFSRIYHDAGMYQEALAEAQKAFEVSQSPWNQAQIADNLAHLGRTQEAGEILADIQDRARGMTCAVEVAQTYAVLRRKGEALQWLEYAYQSRAPHLLLSINRNPDFAWLRAEQQFQDLVRRIDWPQ